MSIMHSDSNQQWIEVEIRNRRLPARMIANRIRADLRHPNITVRRSGPSRSRVVLTATAAALLPAISLARLRELG